MAQSPQESGAARVRISPVFLVLQTANLFTGRFIKRFSLIHINLVFQVKQRGYLGRDKLCRDNRIK